MEIHTFTKEEIKSMSAADFKRTFRRGSAVVLISHMQTNPNPAPIGSQGIVVNVNDDLATTVRWDNGTYSSCQFLEDELEVTSDLINNHHKEVIGWAIHAIHEATAIQESTLDFIKSIAGCKNLYLHLGDLYEALPTDDYLQCIAQLQDSTAIGHRCAARSLGQLYAWLTVNHELSYLQMSE